MGFETILYEQDGPVVTITMNRAERKNAMTNRMVRETGDALAYAAEDREVRVLLLTGAETSFCPGADLQAVARLQLALRRDALVVDVGAIFAAEIADGDVIALDDDRAVMAADQVAAGAELTVLGPADVELRSRYLEHLSGAAPHENLELHFHRRRFLRVESGRSLGGGPKARERSGRGRPRAGVSPIG